MPANGKSKFAGLVKIPQALPDEPDDQAVAPVPAQLVPQALAQAEQDAPPSPGPAPRKAALTVRLHRSAAEPLRESWLSEHRRDPYLSYAEYASQMIAVLVSTPLRQALSDAQLRDPNLSHAEFAGQLLALGLAQHERLAGATPSQRDTATVRQRS